MTTTATAKVVVSAQVDPAVRAELERRAAAGYRSLSAEIRRLLNQATLERANDEGSKHDD